MLAKCTIASCSKVNYLHIDTLRYENIFSLMNSYNLMILMYCHLKFIKKNRYDIVKDNLIDEINVSES